MNSSVNSAMFKYYFHNKEGLYKAMILAVTGQIMTNFKIHLTNTDLTTIDGFLK